jgi:hypothetical protein
LVALAARSQNLAQDDNPRPSVRHGSDGDAFMVNPSGKRRLMRRSSREGPRGGAGREAMMTTERCECPRVGADGLMTGTLTNKLEVYHCRSDPLSAQNLWQLSNTRKLKYALPVVREQFITRLLTPLNSVNTSELQSICAKHSRLDDQHNHREKDGRRQ